MKRGDYALNTNEFKYGSVLKVTRYDTEEDIEKHFSLMRDCGMDTVVIWPAAFWWNTTALQPCCTLGSPLLQQARWCWH